jgi:hypothetical protein
MGPLQQIKENFSGADIHKHLTDLDRMMRDPKMAEVIADFQANGTVTSLPAASNGASTEDDEYLTDEQRKINELEAQLAQLNGRLASQETGQGAQALQSRLEEFFANWPSPPDVQERVRKSLIGTGEGWSRNGEVGRKALEALSSPEGINTVEVLALRELSQAERKAAIQAAALRTEHGLASLGTESLSEGASTGGEAPPAFKSSLEALRWARANPTKHWSR